MNKVLVLDFGSQYTQLIARKVRELGVYSEIFPFDTPHFRIKKENPGAIILSGGPQSVYEDGAPLPDPAVFNLGIPVLGICYGLQLMAHLLGGKVVPSAKREYGFAGLRILDRRGLFKRIKDRSQVWMSHGDRVEKLPPGFILTARTMNTKVAAIEAGGPRFFGVQFHPEVIHTRQGQKILANFLFDQAGLKPGWSMKSFVANKTAEVRRVVGKEKVICGLSGGVDSLVTSLLVQRAVGKRLTCVFVDNGLLRKGQYEELMNEFRRKLSLRVVGVEASGLFLERLRGVVSPEQKRKTIGRTFIDIFEEEARRIGRVKFLAQGTIYPDVIESAPVRGPSATIKSHHNVGGLPRGLRFQLIEPLKELFKDEVRAVAEELGVDREFIAQHPFPGPGLAVRILGEVTRQRVAVLQEADRILLDEVRRAGLYHRLWQVFAVLLPVRSVGVMGDKRTYEQVVSLRLVQSVDGMTANWYAADPQFLERVSTRIVNEVEGVNRVVYDITTKPPATIEWE
ncbi:MAG: glutamine-hydrolyzing GMP synthase [Clostridiales bacterium]|nr:glutamine-hydrolyzing GMP synthase [Clostridiales bacterium]